MSALTELTETRLRLWALFAAFLRPNESTGKLPFSRRRRRAATRVRRPCQVGCAARAPVPRIALEGDARRCAARPTVRVCRETCDADQVTARERRVERFEFKPDDPAMVVACMTQLAGARDGWINLLPAVVDDEDAPKAPTGFSRLFGGGNPGITMGTWVPAGEDRRGRDPTRLGIVHACGRFATARLRSQDLAVPPGWFVEQDHPERGLVLRVPSDTPHAEVLDWALRAGRALCTVRLTGKWQAEVHFPGE